MELGMQPWAPSHENPVLEERIFQVVREAGSKRNKTHKKLDGEICCEDTIRWGAWFAILNRMSEDLEVVGEGGGGGAPIWLWGRRAFQGKEREPTCWAGCVVSLLGSSKEASVAAVRSVRWRSGVRAGVCQAGEPLSSTLSEMQSPTYSPCYPELCPFLLSCSFRSRLQLTSAHSVDSWPRHVQKSVPLK